MRILAFYPYIPWPLNRGAYHRAYHLLKGLARGHEVDLLALSEGGEGLREKGLFEPFCGRVEAVPFEHPKWEKLFPRRLLNPLPSTVVHWRIGAVGAALDQMVRDGKYDAVHVLDLVLAQYFLSRWTAIPCVLDRTRVDLQYQSMERKRAKASFKERVLNLEHHAKLARFEKGVARRCALQIVCGPDDADFIRRRISARVPLEVIPNGVDLDYFRREPDGVPRAPEPTLIFCGAMDYLPNVDALRWYFAEIHDQVRAQVPDLRVLIVGKDPAAEVRAHARRPEVTVTGAVPDVRPDYRKAWAQIVPLRIGGGTRLKIVESLAIQTPVVSTEIGAQGLALEHGKDVLLANTAADFARETVRLLRDHGLRARLERAGLQTVRARLSWDKLGGDLRRAYERRFPVKIGSARTEPVSRFFSASSTAS